MALALERPLVLMAHVLVVDGVLVGRAWERGWEELALYGVGLAPLPCLARRILRVRIRFGDVNLYVDLLALTLPFLLEEGPSGSDEATEVVKSSRKGGELALVQDVLSFAPRGRSSVRVSLVGVRDWASRPILRLHVPYPFLQCSPRNFLRSLALQYS